MAGIKLKSSFIWRIMTFFVIVLLISALQGCDCWSNLYLEIKNISNAPIKVIVTKNNGDVSEYTIADQSTTNILSDTGPRCKCQKCMGQPISDTNIVTLFISKIEVIRNDSTVSKTNFINYSNWEFESQKDLSIYRATVKPTDF